WALQINSVFIAQSITDKRQQVAYAATALEDAALHWYLNQCQANDGPAPWDDWRVFVDALKQAFQPPHYQSYLRMEIQKLRQTSSVQDYTTKFQNLVEQIEDMGELDKVMHYVEGLKSATQQEVKYQTFQTLEDAWKLAVRYDTAMFSSNRSKNDKRYSDRRPGSNKRHEPRSTPRTDNAEPMELDAAERFHKKGFKKSVPNGNCYNCGEPGHIARNCKGKKVARLTNTEEPVVVREELGSIHDNKEQLLRFNGKINGHSAWILLDSGASRNFIATPLTDLLHKDCEFIWTNAQ